VGAEAVKVLALFQPCGPSYVSRGWQRVFEALGHEWKWFNEGDSLHDVFATYKPTLVCWTTYGLTSALHKCLRDHPETRLVMFASAWGPLTDRIDRQKYPIVIVTDDEKRKIERLKRETGRPDFVHLHCPDDYVEDSLGGWRSIGVEPVGILNGGDTFAYLGGVSKPEYECDIAYTGGYWGFKSSVADAYFLPLLHPDHRPRLTVRLYGNQPWPVSQYGGMFPEDEAKDLYASAKVCPNLHEPHSHFETPDWVERSLKVPLAGGFVVTDEAVGFRKEFGEHGFVICSNPAEYREAILYYVAHPEERLPLMAKQKACILRGHTYFARVAKALRRLGMDGEAGRCDEMARQTCEREGVQWA
jgi:hypothetical protein